MKIELNISKKHLYISAVIVTILAFVVFAAANSRNPGHDYNQLDLGPIVIGDTIPEGTLESNVQIYGGIAASGPSAIPGAFTYYDCPWPGESDEWVCSCPENSRFISGSWLCSPGGGTIEEQANMAFYDKDTAQFRVDCDCSDNSRHLVDEVSLVCTYESIEE